MTWMITSDGFEAHIKYPVPDAFEIERIAHSLGQINRFNGHASRPYSVAEHSLLVADVAEHMGLDVFGQMAALMHDAHEAFVGDVTSPVKDEIGAAWFNFENRFAHMLASKFGLITAFTAFHHEIKSADLTALAIERYHLLPNRQPCGTPSTPWPCLAQLHAVHHFVDLNTPEREAMTWRDWADRFVDRFHELQFARAELCSLERQAA